MWKLAIEDDQGHKTVVNLVRDEYTVGRAQENTVRLTERNISRQHAVLQRVGPIWSIEDRGSYNGCYVNGVRVAEPRPLDAGDLIQVGDYRLEVIDDSVVAQPGYTSRPSSIPITPHRQTLTGQPDRLVMLVGPNPGMEFPLSVPKVVIGRGEECDVSLNHGSVSRVHADIQALGDGRYEIIDRESANGVRVNGAELQRALLDARDTIELGDIVLKYIPAGMIYRPGADESQQIGAYGPIPEPITTAPRYATNSLPSSILTPGRIAAVVGALVLASILGVFIVASTSTGRETTPSAETEGAARVLEEAKLMLAQSRVEDAHVHITTRIPETSNARKSQDFVNIEARWADTLFALAGAETNRDRKRELLERIATTDTVDAERRKRADDMITALDAGGVELSQLPPAKPLPDAPPPESPVADAEVDLDAAETAAVDPTPLSPEETQDAPPPAATDSPKPPKTTMPSSQLTKKATSGDRADQLSAINALRAKKRAGTITAKETRILGALCRQHGIPDC